MCCTDVFCGSLARYTTPPVTTALPRIVDAGNVQITWPSLARRAIERIGARAKACRAAIVYRGAIEDAIGQRELRQRVRGRSAPELGSARRRDGDDAGLPGRYSALVGDVDDAVGHHQCADVRLT